MAVWLLLALPCKEDVGLVVAGFGTLLWFTGHPRVGRRTLAAGLGWFLLTALVLIPLANGRASPHLELNYGITGSGPSVVLEAVPTLVGNAWQNVVDGEGGTYLLLIFAPFLGLPLLDPRWLLPATPPILLNLAATYGYQQEIRYQYLATAAPFLALATIAGLQVVARHQVVLASRLVALVAVAGFVDYRVGPAPRSRGSVGGPLGHLRVGHLVHAASVQPHLGGGHHGHRLLRRRGGHPDHALSLFVAWETFFYTSRPALWAAAHDRRHPSGKPTSPSLVVVG